MVTRAERPSGWGRRDALDPQGPGGAHLFSRLEPGTHDTTSATVTFRANAIDDDPGYGQAFRGDLDGDGLHDPVLSARAASGGRGEVSLFFGAR